MDLEERAEAVRSTIDLASFVLDLADDLEVNEEDWENPDLDRFLRALAAWLEDATGKVIHERGLTPERPSWRDLAMILLAARGYE